jgi:hypothetical protein
LLLYLIAFSLIVQIGFFGTASSEASGS